MRRMMLSAAVAVLALAAAACGPKPGDTPRPAGPLIVQATNHNRSDVNVYLLRGGTRTRLGTVVSGDTHTFVVRHVRPELLRDLGFYLERIGATEAFLTPHVSVEAGETVRLQVEDLITTSAVTVAQDGEGAPAKPLP